MSLLRSMSRHRSKKNLPLQTQTDQKTNNMGNKVFELDHGYYQHPPPSRPGYIPAHHEAPKTGLSSPILPLLQQSVTVSINGRHDIPSPTIIQPPPAPQSQPQQPPQSSSSSSASTSAKLPRLARTLTGRRRAGSQPPGSRDAPPRKMDTYLNSENDTHDPAVNHQKPIRFKSLRSLFNRYNADSAARGDAAVPIPSIKHSSPPQTAGARKETTGNGSVFPSRSPSLRQLFHGNPPVEQDVPALPQNAITTPTVPTSPSSSRPAVAVAPLRMNPFVPKSASSRLFGRKSSTNVEQDRFSVQPSLRLDLPDGGLDRYSVMFKGILQRDSRRKSVEALSTPTSSLARGRRQRSVLMLDPVDTTPATTTTSSSISHSTPSLSSGTSQSSQARSIQTTPRNMLPGHDSPDYIHNHYHDNAILNSIPPIPQHVPSRLTEAVGSVERLSYMKTRGRNGHDSVNPIATVGESPVSPAAPARDFEFAFKKGLFGSTRGRGKPIRIGTNPVSSSGPITPSTGNANDSTLSIRDHLRRIVTAPMSNTASSTPVTPSSRGPATTTNSPLPNLPTRKDSLQPQYRSSENTPGKHTIRETSSNTTVRIRSRSNSSAAKAMPYRATSGSSSAVSATASSISLGSSRKTSGSAYGYARGSSAGRSISGTGSGSDFGSNRNSILSSNSITNNSIRPGSSKTTSSNRPLHIVTNNMPPPTGMATATTANVVRVVEIKAPSGVARQRHSMQLGQIYGGAIGGGYNHQSPSDVRSISGSAPTSATSAAPAPRSASSAVGPSAFKYQNQNQDHNQQQDNSMINDSVIIHVARAMTVTAAVSSAGGTASRNAAEGARRRYMEKLAAAENGGGNGGSGNTQPRMVQSPRRAQVLQAQKLQIVNI